MNKDIANEIRELVKSGKENGFILISELDQIIKD